jgi:hypothetical protein
MAHGIRIVELMNGQPTEHDGRWLVEYEPAPYPQPSFLVTTADPGQARRFGSAADARECWMQSVGTRPWDGRPNRPLTAFTVFIEPLPDC